MSKTTRRLLLTIVSLSESFLMMTSLSCYSDLEEEIYMKQLDGFHVEGKEDYVCRLRKSLYGLKQASR